MKITLVYGEGIVKEIDADKLNTTLCEMAEMGELPHSKLYYE